jgi:hypothetical protein
MASVRRRLFGSPLTVNAAIPDPAIQTGKSDGARKGREVVQTPESRGFRTGDTRAPNAVSHSQIIGA